MDFFSHALTSIGLALTTFFGVPAEPVMLGAQAAINAFQGGTGSTSPSGILYGDETIRLKTVTIGNNLTFSGGTLSATGGASSTLLADSNIFSGNNTFSNTITGAITGNAGSATILQTSRNINGVAFNGSANITITAASSTLLSDNNTFSNTITGSITGNAGTATALAGNGTNASAGNAILGVDASGNAEGAFDVWTEAENTSAAYISDGNTNWDNSYGFTTFAYPFPSDATSTALTFSGGLTTSLITLSTNGEIKQDFGSGVDSFLLGTTTNTFLGNGLNPTTAFSGADNVYVGNDVGSVAVTKNRNTFIGSKSNNNPVGSGADDQTALGYNALAVSRGNGNIAIGANSAANVTSGTFNIGIGAGINFASNTASQQLNIGNLLFGTGVYNSTTSSATAVTGGTIGIGTTTPGATFGVQGDALVSGNFNVANITATGTVTAAYASTTGFSTAYASSTLYYGAGLADCNTGNMLTWTAGRFGCEDDSTTGGSSFSYPFPSNATTTLIAFNGGLTSASTTLTGNFVFANATGTNATTTNLAISGGLTFNNVTGTTWASFCTTITGSSALCDGDDASAAGGGAYPFTPGTFGSTNTSATSTAINDTAGFISTGSSTLQRLDTLFGTTTFSTSTTASFTNASTSNLVVSGVRSALHLAGSDGTVSAYAGSSCAAGTFGNAWSAVGAATCAAAAAFPFTVGTVGSTVSSATSTLINGTGGFFSTGSSTLQRLVAEYGTTTNATSTTLNVSGQIDFDSLTSALIITGAGGILAEYAGTSCTNQFVRSLSVLGAATCASINNGDWSGTDLSVANGGTGLSTFGGTNTVLYTTAADTLSSEAAFTYNPSTDVLTTVAASTTNLTVGTWFQIPSLASFTSVLAGAFGLDTTQNQLKIGTGSNSRVYATDEKWMRVPFASTTQGVGSTTIYAGPAPFAQTFTTVQCDFSNFMGVSLYDGTNRSTYFVASSTIGTTTLASNNSFNMGETIRIDVGTSTDIGAAVRGGCTFKYRIDPT